MKEQEKTENFSELKREVKKIWDMYQVGVVPIVVAALGVTSKKLNDWLTKLGVKSSTELLQKAVLMGAERITRQVVET